MSQKRKSESGKETRDCVPGRVNCHADVILSFAFFYCVQVLTQHHIFADAAWRNRFARLRMNGFRNLHLIFTLRYIVFPILLPLLTLVCIPLVIARGLLPFILTTALPEWLFPNREFILLMESAGFRYAWTVALVCVVGDKLWRRAKRWFKLIHDAIRDDRYLVGRRLHNYREAVHAANVSAANNVGNVGGAGR